MKDRIHRPARAALFFLALALLAACSAATVESQPTADAPTMRAEAGGLLYVCNQDDATVSIIDLETRRVIRTVDLQALGFSENARPHHIVVEPGGAHWYVSLIGEGQVVKLDREDRVVGTAPFATPGMMALRPDGERLYVGRSMTAVNPPARIGAIIPSGMEIEEIDVFFPRPHAIALDPRTGIVYTASLGVNQIAAVDPETERAVLTDVAGEPHALMQFALSPDGRTLAISGEISHTVHFFDLSEDPYRPRHLGVVEVGAQPFDPIFTRDGETLWLGNKAAGTITAIDVASREIVAVLDDARIRQPHGAAASMDGRWILISNTNTGEDHAMMSGTDDHAGHADHEPVAAPRENSGNGSIAVIDARTRQLVDVIEVGRNATGIAVVPAIER